MQWNRVRFLGFPDDTDDGFLLATCELNEVCLSPQEAIRVQNGRFQHPDVPDKWNRWDGRGASPCQDAVVRHQNQDGEEDDSPVGSQPCTRDRFFTVQKERLQILDHRDACSGGPKDEQHFLLFARDTNLKHWYDVPSCRRVHRPDDLCDDLRQ